MIYVVKYLFLIYYINTIFLKRVLFCYSYNLSHNFSLHNNSNFASYPRNKKRNKINKYHNIYYHKGDLHYENNIANNYINDSCFLNKYYYIYHKKKHKLNYFNSPILYDDECILKNPFNSFTTKEGIKNKNSYKHVNINVMRKKGMLYLTFNNKKNDNTIKNDSNYDVDQLDICNMEETNILPSTRWGHFSLFYGSSLNRDYYTYEDIIKYIQTNKKSFIKCINNNKNNDNNDKNNDDNNNNNDDNNDNNNNNSVDVTKETFIDKKCILIRGRIEKKKKQSKRIFLYVRLNNGIYLTCVYEKKIPTNKNNESIYPIDNMYTYIKNLKNESVIDIVGKIKLHGILYKHDVPYIESFLNQKTIEIVVEQIDCISESFYNPPISINDSDMNTDRMKMIIWGDNKIEDTDKAGHTKNNIIDKSGHTKNNIIDKADHTKNNIIDESGHTKNNIIVHYDHTANNINDHSYHTANNIIDHSDHTPKNNIDHSYHTPNNNLRVHHNNNFEEEKKINTNENMLKVENLCLNYRNAINHIILYIKSKIFQRFRDMLERDGHTEIFTPKFIKIKESEKKQSFDINENNYEEMDDNNIENNNSSENNIIENNNSSENNNINVQLTGSEGGCKCYKLEGQNIVLSQSPQLYKQMLINSDFDKIYEINYCYRNEKFHTSRHLNEFMSLDIERVIYDNYYEIIIYMYNILKNMNTYINNTFSNELNILSSFYNNNININNTYTASQFSDNPIVISFSEAQDILDKYYRNNKKDILLHQQNNMNNKNTYIYNKKHNKYIKILNEEEKKNMEEKIIFQSSQKDKLHNIYYYNKILKYYKINKQQDIFKYETYDMDKEYNKMNKYNDTYYQFLNTYNKDEFYRQLLLFFNNMYDKYDEDKKKLQENKANELKIQNEIINGQQDGVIFKCDESDNNKDAYIKTMYDFINIINKNNKNNKNKKNNINNNDNNNDNYDNYDDGNIFITEPLSYNNLKNKYILYDDFTNDELNYLYLFIKNNFHSDIFIIDQYPIFLRPYYTCSNMYDLRFSNSYDFIYKGMEIISGSQRINNLPILLFKTLKENKLISFSTYLHNQNNFYILNYLNNFKKLINKKSTIYKYFNSFQYASKPHGGLALGIERYLMTLLNINNIKNVTLSE
ncbi:aspartate--tRNA ligase, putative [Plasmodium sp. gorilla clade G2]|uniref:aspartate--tRNA ligase, putative n=1 Tax=Plasmodium sp. gorilla clade G2 TaxID=880535 RepID=UPI000D1FFEEB|nr:aspartate--tRNA ligase, putative [Plasmodium sp. gorilla clade G2]SOV11675.1 aspartate--tRNA ligase, putative [Plasmodium sp. gorilla clade G2]